MAATLSKLGPSALDYVPLFRQDADLDKNSLNKKKCHLQNVELQKKQPTTEVTMTSVPDQPNLEAARKFQQDLLKTFSERGDAILQLVEALASAEKPSSIVELCQEGAFQRTYSNIHKAIDALSMPATVTAKLILEKPLDDTSLSDKTENLQQPIVDPALFLELTRQWTQLFAQQLHYEPNQPFRLFALDATPAPKPFAETMQDRTFVHKANCVGSPVTIGIQASVLIAVPERKANEAKWPLPLMVDRISSAATPCKIAEQQLKELNRLPGMANAFCVIAVDAGYSLLQPQSDNQVVIARSRINRIGKRSYTPSVSELPAHRGRGRPRKYSRALSKP